MGKFFEKPVNKQKECHNYMKDNQQKINVCRRMDDADTAII